MAQPHAIQWTVQWNSRTCAPHSHPLQPLHHGSVTLEIAGKEDVTILGTIAIVMFVVVVITMM